MVLVDTAGRMQVPAAHPRFVCFPCVKVCSTAAWILSRVAAANVLSVPRMGALALIGFVRECA